MLNLSRGMIYKLVEAGAFPIVKIGTRSVIAVAAIEEYLKGCPVGVAEFPGKKSTAPAPIATTPAEPPLQHATTAESVAAE
jgi:excisionase family DNA binding protein